MNDLKYKLAEKEYKDKWSWKALAKKRTEIESEKTDMKKKIVSTVKVNKSRQREQSRTNENLGKRLNSMSEELEFSEKQKNALKSKVKELEV